MSDSIEKAWKDICDCTYPKCITRQRARFLALAVLEEAFPPLPAESIGARWEGALEQATLFDSLRARIEALV